jgi:predicted nucleic acid-binding protein
MNVVDSSGWLEYFGDGPNADFFASAIRETGSLIVPAVTLYEVFKRVALQRGEGSALQAVAMMLQGRVVDLDARIALDAAKVSMDSKLPMADSIILATARIYDAALWTQDGDLKPFADVRYVAKR